MKAHWRRCVRCRGARRRILDYTDPIGAGQRVRDRVELLLELAGHDKTTSSRRLSCSRTCKRACSPKPRSCSPSSATSSARMPPTCWRLPKIPRQRMAAQQLYRDYVRRGDFASADTLLETLCRVNPDARERCLALCTRAELCRAEAPARWHEQVVALLEQARREQPASLLSGTAAGTALVANRPDHRLRRGAARSGRARGYDADARAAVTRSGPSVGTRRASGNKRWQATSGRTTHDPHMTGALARQRTASTGTAPTAQPARVRSPKLATVEKHPELSARSGRASKAWSCSMAWTTPAQATPCAARPAQRQWLACADTRGRSRRGSRGGSPRAREAWAQASGGVVRGLIRAEQARARRRSAAASEPAATSCAASHPWTQRGRAAAQSGGAVRRSRELARRARALSEISPSDAGFLDADILAFDCAAELSEFRSCERRCVATPSAGRIACVPGR